MQLITTGGATVPLMPGRHPRQGVVVAAPNVTLDGGDGRGGRHRIDFNTDAVDDCFAVYGFGGSSPLQNQVAAATGLTPQAGWKRADNLTLQNCHFKLVGAWNNFGAQLAKRCHGVAGPILRNLRLINCVIETGGEDAHTVYCPDSQAANGSAYLEFCQLTTDQRGTANRHAGPANVRIAKLQALHNLVVGGNSGFNCNALGSYVANNLIAHSNYDTNGYGCFSYKPQGVQFVDNLIMAAAGRGIIWHGWEKGDMPLLPGVENLAKRNIILAADRPNAEYADSLRTKGILARWQQPFARIADNTVLALAGGDFTDAYGLQFHLPDDSTGSVTGNKVMAIRLAGSHSHTAKTLGLDGQGASDLRIEQNDFAGNQYLVATAGNEPGCRQRAPLICNRLDWITGEQARARFLIAAAEWLSGATWLPAQTRGAWLWRLAGQLGCLEGAALRPDRKILYTGRWYDPAKSATTEESLTMLRTEGPDGRMVFEADDIYQWVPSSPGVRQFTFGRTGVDGEPLEDYVIGRATATAGEPYTKRLI